MKLWQALAGANVILLAALAWTSAQSQAPATDVIRARLIELIDANGEMRAQLRRRTQVAQRGRRHPAEARNH
jgi:hypothetical protein